MKISRQALYKALWEFPIGTLASRWNVNPGLIRNAAKMLEVPRPPSGHWTALAHNKAVICPLREPSMFCPNECDIPTLEAHDLPEGAKDEILRLIRGDELEGRNLHRAVRETKKAMRATGPHKAGVAIYPNQDMPRVNCVVTKTTQARALRILDCVLFCAEAVGVELHLHDGCYQMKQGDQCIDFWLKERFVQVPIPEENRKWYDPKFDLVAAGTLEFHFETTYTRSRCSWKDGQSRRLENVVEDIVKNIPIVIQAHRARRLRIEERDRIYAEAARKREEERRREINAAALRDALFRQAERWDSAQKVSRFLAAARQSVQGKHSDQFVSWASWVDGLVTNLDPLAIEPKPWEGWESSASRE